VDALAGFCLYAYIDHRDKAAQKFEIEHRHGAPSNYSQIN